MKIGVDPLGDLLEAPAPVLRAHQAGVQVEDPKLILRVHEDVGVIKGPVCDSSVVIDGLPTDPSVIGAEKGTPLGLHQRVDHSWIVSRNAQPDPSELPLWETVRLGEPRPGIPSIVGEEEAASGSSRFEEPRPAPEFPHRREELVRVSRVHDQVGDTCPLIHKQDSIPGDPAVGRPVNPPLISVAPCRTHDADVGHIGIRGV